jgi:exopolysaccharide biosynthesis protein
MSRKIKKKLIISTIILFLLITAYLAADRYLIRHVEIADVSAYASAVAQTTSADGSVTVATAAVPTAQAADAQVTEDLAEDQPAVVENTDSTITYDDWNYQSDAISISITEYSSGSGNDALTYYVADVVVSDATQLSSAFADNQFGTNIITYTSEIAADNNAIFAINGDYYGFRDDGILIRNGVIYRDDPARTGLAFYLDGSMQVYDEIQTSAEELLAAGVWNTLSFGPALLDDGAIVENLSTVEIDTNFGNHPIQGDQPRTGIGIIDNNHFVFIVVDGRSKGYSMGVSLDEFAEIFQQLGCTEAYNLDGGGSSTMYFLGRVVNNPLGKNKERGTSDILFIGAEA